MNKLTVPLDEVEIDLGKETITAPLLDIYYTMISDTLGPEGQLKTISTKQKMETMAASLNAEYNCNISWGQAAHLLSVLDDKMGDLKKNTTLEPESPDGTE